MTRLEMLEIVEVLTDEEVERLEDVLFEERASRERRALKLVREGWRHPLPLTAGVASS